MPTETMNARICANTKQPCQHKEPCANAAQISPLLIQLTAAKAPESAAK